MYLVISTSLHPNSRSRILAGLATRELNELDQPHEAIDLAALKPLPPCNGFDCYSDPLVGELSGKIAGATGILLASPVYNYDVSASCKNLIELTGSAWNEKVVGLLCAAGGQGSYMAPMSLCSSLMLDFRCLILPKFVYAEESRFEEGALQDSRIEDRIRELAAQMVKIGEAI